MQFSTCSIDADTQLTVDYGKSYWSNKATAPVEIN
jgi:hypothetical protein